MSGHRGQMPSKSHRPVARVAAGLIALSALIAVGHCAQGRGYKTWMIRRVYAGYNVPHHPPARPSVVRTRPADRDGNIVPGDLFVAADVDLPYGGNVVDGATLNSDSVRLYRTHDQLAVSAVVNTSGAGDAIVLRPMQTLDAGTEYTFEVTDLAKDTGGHAFQPYTAHFWTSAGQRLGEFPAAFEKIKLPTARGHMFTCVTIGPDHRLYASTLSGHIFRYAILTDGVLSAPEAIETINIAAGRARLITGITFDPAAKADHLVLWVSHGELPDGGEKGQAAIRGANDWTGKITRLQGPSLEQ